MACLQAHFAHGGPGSCMRCLFGRPCLPTIAVSTSIPPAVGHRMPEGCHVLKAAQAMPMVSTNSHRELQHVQR